MNRSFAAVALSAVVSLACAPGALARPFQMTPDHHSLTEASFTSRALIVRMTGRTSHVEGQGEIDVNDPSKSAMGELAVDLTTLDTGIAMRNEHMRGMIEADKYPKAIFKVKGLKAVKLTAKEPVVGTVTGDLTIHGVTRAVTAPVTLTYFPEEDKKYREGDWVGFSTEFKIKLSDYGINLMPAIVGQKVANDLTIDFDGMAKGM